MTERKQALRRIQEAEQAMQSLLQQKQAFLNQRAEAEEALKELEKSNIAYQIVANIMIRKEPDEIRKGLDEQQEMISLRIKAIEKQEDKIKGEIKEYQEMAMKGD